MHSNIQTNTPMATSSDGQGVENKVARQLLRGVQHLIDTTGMLWMSWLAARGCGALTKTVSCVVLSLWGPPLPWPGQVQFGKLTHTKYSFLFLFCCVVTADTAGYQLQFQLHQGAVQALALCTGWTTAFVLSLYCLNCSCWWQTLPLVRTYVPARTISIRRVTRSQQPWWDVRRATSRGLQQAWNIGWAKPLWATQSTELGPAVLASAKNCTPAVIFQFKSDWRLLELDQQEIHSLNPKSSLDTQRHRLSGDQLWTDWV